MLSSLEDLLSVPRGTLLANCCGIITKIMDTPKKVSVVFMCASGEQFVATEFKATVFSPLGVQIGTAQKKQSLAVLQDFLCVGNVLKLVCVKAQRFNSKFDGKVFFGTPLDYEFIITKNSKVFKETCGVTKVDKFVRLEAGRFFALKCVLTAPFTLVDSMFAAVVGDLDAKRADLFMSGDCLSEKFGSLGKNDQLELKRCFIRFEDVALQIHVLSSDVVACNCKVVLDGCLTTPVKRKSDEMTLVSLKTQKK
ncbi:hypothetical protein niasHT_005457 [Heterodera trifolii]|uniref:Uncharacterized protein n=1 Tax=Heterodera trifolii TaxID=157864 RepID=A0ABD2M7N3_9BILA